VLDIIYNFRTAFITVHNLRRSIVRDPGLIAEYYMRHGSFWPDLLAALPIVAEARRPARPRACVAQPARPVQAVASGSCARGWRLLPPEPAARAWRVSMAPVRLCGQVSTCFQSATCQPGACLPAAMHGVRRRPRDGARLRRARGAQATVIGIPFRGGGLAVHIILLLRLFRMWRVIKLVEVRRIPGRAARGLPAVWAEGGLRPRACCCWLGCAASGHGKMLFKSAEVGLHRVIRALLCERRMDWHIAARPDAPRRAAPHLHRHAGALQPVPHAPAVGRAHVPDQCHLCHGRAHQCAGLHLVRCTAPTRTAPAAGGATRAPGPACATV